MERAEQEELANGGEYTGADDGEWIDYDNLSGNRVCVLFSLSFFSFFFCTFVPET